MRTDSAVALVAASPAHIAPLARRLRSIDKLEISARGRTAKDGLRLALRSSAWARTAMVAGRPEAMMGIAPISVIEDRGCPWFLGSDEVFAHGRDLLSIGPRVIEHMHGGFRRLENSVSVGNSRAIRLLARWGFTVGGDEFMVGNVAFVRFWREATACASPQH